MKSILSVISGLAIGYGIVISMELMLCIFGIWGWFALPIILAFATFLALLALCLPCYFEERKVFKEYEQKQKLHQ